MRSRRNGKPHGFGPWGFASTVGRVFRTGYGNKRPGGSTGTTTKRRRYDPGITQQHDVARQYRYKRMPRKLRRRFKRRYKLFRNRLLKDLGTQTIIRNNNVTITALSTAQQYAVCHLYGFAGLDNAQEMGCNDMDSIRANDPVNIPDSGKMFFQNAILDISVRNNAAVVLELDQYIILAKPKNRLFASFQAAVNNAQGDTDVIGAGTQILMTTRGATPFEFPDLCKYFKVLSKTKFFIGAGQAITYQLKDRKDRMITGDQFNRASIAGQENAFKDGWTKCVMYIGKTITGSTDSANFTVAATRSYRYKFLDENVNRDAII